MIKIESAKIKETGNKLDYERYLFRLEDTLRSIERLNEKCDQNMKRLNAMMLELKGIVAMVRPQVKKTGWYGDEVESKIEVIDVNIAQYGTMVKLTEKQKVTFKD